MTAPDSWISAQADWLGDRAEIRADRDCPCLMTSAEHVADILRHLRDAPECRFEQLIDLAGLDYAEYGQDEWQTEEASAAGFSRASASATSARYSFANPHPPVTQNGRFAVAYQLLSLSHNRRIRVVASCASGAWPTLPSVRDLWQCADWYEREAFDLFGIVFEGHPDLRRILTDYGFIGHPLRKDFPLSGHMEVRYDPGLRRVIYQPVTIEPRVTVPKVRRGQGHG